jgi:predicted Zn-dependent protease
MADDEGQDERFGSAGALLAAALGPSSPKAEQLLERHIALADLEIEALKREDRIRHWSLRVRHITDVMKLIFIFVTALVGVGLAGAVVIAVWTAAHDHGIVIENFKTPPELSQNGLTGDVVANELLDHIQDIQGKIDSIRAPGSYSSNPGDPIKVEIPDTGISIGEAYRFLQGWLGTQTHITGEITRDANGLVLTARVGGDVAARIAGSPRDLDALIARAAESIYSRTQPYRYANYLLGRGRFADAEKTIRDLALNGPARERPWAYTLWATFAQFTGDLPDALFRAQKAVELGPRLVLPEGNLRGIEAAFGHDERELAAGKAIVGLIENAGGHELAAYAVASALPMQKAMNAEQVGDYEEAIAQYRIAADVPDYAQSHLAGTYAIAADLALLHETSASRRALGAQQSDTSVLKAAWLQAWAISYVPTPQFYQYANDGDWTAARKDLEALIRAPKAHDPAAVEYLRPQNWPWLALARAKTGDIRGAEWLIAQTPVGCDLCARMRGRIAAEKKDWREAQAWFAMVEQRTPSIPFADADWGTMLLAKGDADGAIAKLALANKKGPHFADPLEMWGEALMAKNRSDLALAKFEEANKYAPNWGRLHLKWGNALGYLGRKDEAKAQFAIAATLDLPPADKAELSAATRNP